MKKLTSYKTEIIDLYVNQLLTCKQIGKKFGVCAMTIGKFLTNNKVMLRKRGSKQTTYRPWNAGITLDTTGMSIKLIEEKKYLRLSDSAIRRHMKRYLIYKYGHRCSICNTEYWQGQPVPIICDHIDGKHDNKEINNFRLVCCNCDAQLPTYKSKNNGNGLKYDREYYHKTK